MRDSFKYVLKTLSNSLKVLAEIAKNKVEEFMPRNFELL